MKYLAPLTSIETSVLPIAIIIRPNSDPLLQRQSLTKGELAMEKAIFFAVCSFCDFDNIHRINFDAPSPSLRYVLPNLVEHYLERHQIL